jgi:hypothetical protein
MARTPQKTTSHRPGSGEHIIFHGPGPYLLPDLIRCERVEKSRWANVVVVQALTYAGGRLAIPLLNPAVTSLLAASSTVVRFETLCPGRQIETPERRKTLEVPVLYRFVCFRAITKDWRMAEFLTRRDQRVLVPFSSEAYGQMIDHLKALASAT